MEFRSSVLSLQPLRLLLILLNLNRDDQTGKQLVGITHFYHFIIFIACRSLYLKPQRFLPTFIRNNSVEWWNEWTYLLENDFFFLSVSWLLFQKWLSFQYFFSRLCEHRSVVIFSILFIKGIHAFFNREFVNGYTNCSTNESTLILFQGTDLHQFEGEQFEFFLYNNMITANKMMILLQIRMIRKIKF